MRLETIISNWHRERERERAAERSSKAREANLAQLELIQSPPPVAVSPTKTPKLRVPPAKPGRGPQPGDPTPEEIAERCAQLRRAGGGA
jgi:hypothetical protein